MTIRYLHFGPQCPGWAYMEQGGREAAEILGMGFSSIDVSKEPLIALENELYFPGMIVAEGLRLVYPGNGLQIAEIIRRRGPLPGVHDYNQLPNLSPDRIELLNNDNLQLIKGLCIPMQFASGWCDKEKWLQGLGGPILGLVGFLGEQPVAVMEVVPREKIPYPVPDYNGYFITCLYGAQGLEKDFRLGLLKKGYSLLKENGCSRLGVVAGRDTPYPNGPVSLLNDAGFREVQSLGQVLLKHRVENLVFMSIDL